MGISKAIVYTIKCDRCGKTQEVYYGGNVGITEALRANRYEKIKAKILCAECVGRKEENKRAES